MNSLLSIEPTPVVLLVAAAAVVVGAPWFSDGLRAFRLRRCFRVLRTRALGEAPTGLIRAVGRVAIDSPLFSPLSQRPCAGYTLEFIAESGGITRTVREHRMFRVSSGGGTARVNPPQRWDVQPTAERTLAPGDPLSGSLTSLLERAPEALWWRRTGGVLRVVERAVFDGAVVHVVGHARQSRPLEAIVEAEVEMQRTGTDDAAVTTAAATTTSSSRSPLVDVDLWIGRGEHLDYLLIADRDPPQAHFAMPWWRMLGVVLGPALGLSGLLYLAGAVDRMRALGRF